MSDERGRSGGGRRSREPEPGSGGGRESPGSGAGDGGPLPNLAVRVWELLVAPARLFGRLRERPAWVGALVLLIVVGLVSTWLMPEELLRQAATRGMPPDAPAEQVEATADFAATMAYVFSVIGPPIGVAVVAGLLLFVFNVVLGGVAGFEQLFAAVSHAWIIIALGGLLTLPIMIASQDPTAALALHHLVPGLEEGFLYRLLHGLNVFGIWTTVALGIGVGRIYPERTAGSSVAILLSLYLVMKLAWAVAGGFVPGA